MSNQARMNWLYCPLHRCWLVPPDASHEDHPEWDVEECAGVDPWAALSFLQEWLDSVEGSVDDFNGGQR